MAEKKRLVSNAYRLPVLAALVLASILLVARSQGLFREQEGFEGEVLARVGAIQITSGDLEEAIALRSGDGERRFATAESRAELLEQLVRRAAFAEAARDAKLDRDPVVIKEVERVLASQFEENEMARRVARIEVSPRDVEQAYASRQGAFTSPEVRRAAILKIEMAATQSDQARQARLSQAEAARQAAIENAAGAAGFGRVALDYSHDRSSRYKGGDVGWISRADRAGDLPPEVVDTLFALDEVGSISSVVETGSAFYVVRLTDITPARIAPLSEVEDRLREDLRRERLREAHGTLIDETYDVVGVSIYRDALVSVRPPAIAADPQRVFGPPSLPEVR